MVGAEHHVSIYQTIMLPNGPKSMLSIRLHYTVPWKQKNLTELNTKASMAPLYLLLLTLLLAALLYLYLKPRSHAPLPPGPMGWPIVGNLPQLGAKPHQTLYHLSHVHGPLLHLRFGRTHTIVAASAAVASSLLKTHDSNFAGRPLSSGPKVMAYDGHSVAWSPYGERWRNIRKICNLHLFSTKALDGFRHIRQSEAAAMAAGLAAVAAAAAAVEVGPWLNACTANTISRVTMGRRLFAVDGSGREEVREFKEMSVELTNLAGEFVVGDFVPALKWVDVGGVVGRMKRLSRQFDQFLEKIIREHKEESGPAEQNQDFLSVLIRLNEDGDEEGCKITDQEMKGILLVRTKNRSRHTHSLSLFHSLSKLPSSKWNGRLIYIKHATLN